MQEAGEAEGKRAARTPLVFVAGAFCLIALVLIVVIVAGSSVGETSAKALWIALVLALFSVTAYAGVDLAAKRRHLASLGYLTVVVSAAGFAAAVVNLLSEDHGRVAGSLFVASLVAGQCSLLLALQKRQDPLLVDAIRFATVAVVAALGTLAIVDIAASGGDVGPRTFGVLAVLYLLGMGLLPIVRRTAARRPAPPAPTALVEERLDTAPALAPRVTAIDHAVIAVSDWQRSNAFYRDLLGAEIVASTPERTAYRVGDQLLNVHGPGTSAEPLAAVPVAPGSSDLCFVWKGPIAEALKHLARHSVPVVEGPVARGGARGLGESVYFRDPDGSLVELISYDD